MRPPLALVVAAALGGAVGCLVDLAPARDCGDGYVDALVGEDCEPSVADSLAGRCPAGEVPGPGACDAETCTFDRAACTRCGNGVLDPGEACDPADMTQPTCLEGGVARCRSDCTVDDSACAPRCGDGRVDVAFGEECDPGSLTDATHKGFAMKVDCRTLSSPTPRAYGSGFATDCTGCKWDRGACSYCGNQRLESLAVVVDEDLHLDFDDKIQPTPEVCDRGVDGPMADPEALNYFCQPRCGNGGIAVACAYACADTCDDFVAPDDGVPDDCCTVTGATCPYDTEGNLISGRSPCCYALAHPGDPQAPCTQGFDGEKLSPLVCR